MREFKVYEVGRNQFLIGGGPTGIPIPGEWLGYSDKLDAQENCDFLNSIYAAGQKSIQEPIRKLLEL